MFYKIRNILSVSALALLLGVGISFDARALVTLSEEAANDDINKDIPDEFAMFNDDDDSKSAPAPVLANMKFSPPKKSSPKQVFRQLPIMLAPKKSLLLLLQKQMLLQHLMILMTNRLWMMVCFRKCLI